MLWKAGPEGMHLWIALTDPDPEDAKIVLIMVVTERPYTDKTLRLVPGTHPFIRHDSNLDYGGAKPFPSGRVATALADGSAKIQPPISAQTLGEIREALLRSTRTIHYVRDLCAAEFGQSTPHPGSS